MPARKGNPCSAQANGFPAPRTVRASTRPEIAALVSAIALFFFTFVFLSGVANAGLTFPTLTGRVVDDAGILSPETQQRLTALLAEHERQTGNQVVVATLKSLQGTDIATYGYQLGRAWGLGKKGKDNGVLITISPSTHDVRIDVGYGLEGTLTDAQSALIIQNVMLPYFRKGDYDDGVLAGTVDVLRTLGGKPSNVDSIPQPQPDEEPSGGNGAPPIFILLILFFVFGRFFWPLLFLGAFRGPWGGGGFGGGFGGGSFGGGSFGGFSGGGGSFGGGGASGHW
jgi:uncharacterized protein